MPASRHLWSAVVVSLLLHLILLFELPMRMASHAHVLPGPIAVSFRIEKAPPARLTPPSKKQDATVHPRKSPAHRQSGQARSHEEPSAAMDVSPQTSTTEPVRPFPIDLNAISAQIRSMESEKRHNVDKPTRQVDEPSILPSLAKSLRETPQVVQENRSSGGWTIRFSGNRCVHIPADTPIWRESAIGETQWVVTNCPK